MTSAIKKGCLENTRVALYEILRFGFGQMLVTNAPSNCRGYLPTVLKETNGSKSTSTLLLSIDTCIMKFGIRNICTQMRAAFFVQLGRFLLDWLRCFTNMVNWDQIYHVLACDDSSCRPRRCKALSNPCCQIFEWSLSGCSKKSCNDDKYVSDTEWDSWFWLWKLRRLRLHTTFIDLKRN